MNHGDLVRVSLSNLREYRDDAARWLAVEVLLSDEAALGDNDLVIGLQGLQDRLEALTRLRYGAPSAASTAPTTVLPLPGAHKA